MFRKLSLDLFYKTISDAPIPCIFSGLSVIPNLTILLLPFLPYLSLLLLCIFDSSFTSSTLFSFHLFTSIFYTCTFLANLSHFNLALSLSFTFYTRVSLAAPLVLFGFLFKPFYTFAYLDTFTISSEVLQPLHVKERVCQLSFFFF